MGQVSLVFGVGGRLAELGSPSDQPAHRSQGDHVLQERGQYLDDAFLTSSEAPGASRTIAKPARIKLALK